LKISCFQCCQQTLIHNLMQDYHQVLHNMHFMLVLWFSLEWSLYVLVLSRFMECDYRRVFDWWSNLLDSLIQCMTTLYSTLLHTHTHTHALVFTVISSLPLLGSSFQWWTFPFLWVPKLSLASATSFSQQQLTTTGLQFSTNKLIHQPTHYYS
jgi:hypothetical protein